MANHHAAATLLMIVSLFMAVALFEADARPAVHPNKTAALSSNTQRQGNETDAVSELKPACDDTEDPKPQPPEPEPPTCDSCEGPKPAEPAEPAEPPKPAEPAEPPTNEKPEPEPEPKSTLTCVKAYGVLEGETCWCISQREGLSLNTFYSFNPNISCDNLFIGQWVCLNAISVC